MIHSAELCLKVLTTWGWVGKGASTSSELLSHSPAPTRELLTKLAPASLFQMLMTSRAESLKLGHSNPACGVW